MAADEQKINRIACYRCRFYQVTWEPARPYGCTAHGFKSKINPAVVVFQASGIECQLYLPKPPRQEK
jgi:hypothetical protein